MFSVICNSWKISFVIQDELRQRGSTGSGLETGFSWRPTPEVCNPGKKTRLASLELGSGVAQLVEWLPLTPQIHGSIPVIGNF